MEARGARLGAALALLAVTWTSPPPAWPQEPPNIIFFLADDWGWPYHGFIQRYLQAKLAAGELVGDDPDQRGREYLDPQLLMPDDPVPGRPPIDRLITPRLDALAAAGNFFPLAHNSASQSQPAHAIILTGLFPADYVLDASLPPKTTSPVLPEWLTPTYLTMAAGKWQFGLSHVNVDGTAKLPWDRDMPKGGGGGEDARAILKPYDPGVPETQALQGLAMQPVKDFIACARCIDPSKCLPPPTQNREEDSARLAPRAAPGGCTPQPFFILINPFIPHLNYRGPEFCPYFPRDATQCATEPWKTRSIYCNDPSFDWSCPNYFAAVDALATVNRRRKLEYVKFVNAYDRAMDEMMVFLQCPAGPPGCGEDLSANTVVLYRTDHGSEVTPAKQKFNEHGYRTPTVFYDPRPGSQLPPSASGCAGQPGCRNDFAHAVDVLATLRDVSGSTFQCDTGCTPCDATCPNACPCPRPDGQSRYVEGRTLRAPITRSCGVADPTYSQCTFGQRKGSSGIVPLEGWYVLAEITDAGTTHLCKLYNVCGPRPKLFDLRADPNEKANLANVPTSFCGARHAALHDILRTNLIAKGWFDPCFDL